MTDTSIVPAVQSGDLGYIIRAGARRKIDLRDLILPAALKQISDLVLFDDFQRTNTQPGDIGTAVTGQTWLVTDSVSFGDPTTHGQIIDRRVVTDSGATIYLLQQLDYPATRIGGRVSWLPGAGGVQPGVFTLISSLDSGWLSNMVHFGVSNEGWFLQTRTGAGAFITLASGSHALLTDGTIYPVEMILMGSTAFLNIAGKSYTVIDPRIRALCGAYAIWEISYGNAAVHTSELRIESVWATCAGQPQPDPGSGLPLASYEFDGEPVSYWLRLIQGLAAGDIHWRWQQLNSGVTSDVFMARKGHGVLGAPAAALADAELYNSQISFALDEGGHNLLIKVKYSDGTVKTASIALT